MGAVEFGEMGTSLNAAGLSAVFVMSQSEFVAGSWCLWVAVCWGSCVLGLVSAGLCWIPMHAIVIFITMMTWVHSILSIVTFCHVNNCIKDLS